MDNGYLERLDERITTMEDHPLWAIGTNEFSTPAIIELFNKL